MEKKENYKKITIGESSEFLARLRENFPEEIIQGIFDVRINLDYVRKNPLIAKTFSSFEDCPIDKLECERIVLESKDPSSNYLFARDVKGADIKAHERIVLESGNLECICCFATDVDGADIKAHEKIILESKDPRYNYLFPLYLLDEADIIAHSKVVIDSGNERYIKSFCDDIIVPKLDQAWEEHDLSNEKKYVEIWHKFQQALKPQKVLSRHPKSKK